MTVKEYLILINKEFSSTSFQFPRFLPSLSFDGENISNTQDTLFKVIP